MKRLMSGILVLVLAFNLAGCVKYGQASQPVQALGAYELVYNRTSVKSLELVSEYPAIDAKNVFSGDSGLAVQAVKKTTVGEEFEMRAVWISYLDLSAMFSGKTEKKFTARVGAAFDKVADLGLNTVIVQVRPFGDALYKSEYFPWSYVAAGAEGKDPGFDPLEIMVWEARSRGLRIEAWVNPYRVRSPGSGIALSSGNQAQIWLDQETGDAVQYNGGLYYNPASKKAQTLIVNGVKEIVKNYDVDGIHIDDYFYPTTSADFDADAFMAYREGGGKLALADWRRSNVEKLIKKLYQGVKSVNPEVRFGISPQANVNNNYNEQYFDSEKLLASEGYMDYICPQIYFGYQNASYPYDDTVAMWNKMIQADGVDLYVGIAAYKLGSDDQWAGTGKTEWLETEDILMRMVEDGREHSHFQGFSIYRYDSLFNPASPVKTQVEAEKKNLKSVLK